MKKFVLILSGFLFVCGCGGGGKHSTQTTPVISVSLTPAQTAIDQGQTLNYTASVTNDSKNMGVAWSMSGTACTGTGCGTFTNGTTSAAVYDAPASVTAKMTVSITATSVADKTKSVSSAVVVTPAPSITTTSLASGTVGTAYSAALQGSGGAGTLTWSLASGSSLPAGLSLSSAGAISGTPSATANSTFTVKVTDASGAQGGPLSTTQQLSIAINAPAPLTITTTSLSSGVVGTAYAATLQSSGGTGAVAWTLASGSSLPAGLSLSSAGSIFGTPTSAGTSGFTVVATDSGNPQQTASQQLSMVINTAPLAIVTASLPSGVINTAYSEPLQASGGTPPYTWTVASGSSLPTWLTIGGSGTSWNISGTPTATATSSFSLTVADSSSPQQSQTQAYNVTINAVAACSDSGSESLLAGQYAFGISGYSALGYVAAIGSFTADGTGKITAGLIDSNGAIVQSNASIDTTQSFYAVGSNNLGCLTIVTSSGTFTTKLSVGSITSSVATEGRLVEWDSANGNYLTATGQIRKQTVPTSMPSGNYVYELTGAYGNLSDHRTGIVGTVTTQAGSSGGTVTGGEYDINVEGVINNGNGLAAPFSGVTGNYTALDPTTGRFTDTTTLSGVTSNRVDYAVSSSQYLQMTTDPFTDSTGVFVGAMQLQSSSPSLTTGSNLVYYATGTVSAELGLINVTSSTSYTANYFEDVGGAAETPQTPSCAYTVDPLGRVVTSGATCTMYLTSYSKMYPSVFYLTDSNKGFMLGTGLGVYVGQVEPQITPSGGFSATSLSGTFFDGDTEVVNEGVSGEMIDVEAWTFDGTGNLAIIGDYIGGYNGASVNQEADQTKTISLGTVNANGTFSTNSSYGQINAIMISRTKVVNIDDATQPDPVIQVIKPTNPEM
jgi:hypothetical protein